MEPKSNDKKKNTQQVSMMVYGIAIGAGIGVALGAALDNIAGGLAIGIAVRFVFGAGLGLRRKKPDGSETLVE